MNNKTFRKLWKKFWNPILGCGAIQWTIAAIMALCIWGIYFTCRKEITNRAVFEKYKNKPAIFVFWHGRSMMLSPIVCLGGMRSFAVASRHKDGRMMAKLQRLFGLRAIYGSTSKGALSVLREGLRVLRRGDWALCLSPDGPSGPSLRVQEGALYFAKMTGAPIIPVCYSASRAWLQNRWDRYLVALPFSKITCKIGAPVFIDPKINPDQFKAARAELEAFMVHQVHEMDAAFGIGPVEQDLKSGEFKQKLRDERAARRAAKKARRAAGQKKGWIR